MEKCLEQALKDLYNKEVDPRREPDPALYEGFRQTFDHAVIRSFPPTKDKELSEFSGRLKSSNEVFSVFRAHRMSRDMAAQMVDKEGNLKSFDQFRKDVEPIADHHVRQWLRTEYDMAVSRARLAADWLTYEKDRDIMPNLRWVESTAITPDAVHSSFWGTVRPVDDTFWAAHHPGDHWGCQCSLEQTDDPVTPLSDEVIRKAPPPSPGLEENPGKTKRIFSYNSPYFPGSCETCPFRHLLKEPRTEKDCYSCDAQKAVTRDARQKLKDRYKEAARSVPETWTTEHTRNGTVRISSKHGKKERAENRNIARLLANRHGFVIDLIENTENGTSPDSFNHTLGYKQEYKRNKTASKNAVDQAVEHAATQADHIVFDIRSKITEEMFLDGLTDRLRRCENVRTVWVIRGKFDRQFTREEILAKNFEIQWD